jgi:hypothetical protein
MSEPDSPLPPLYARWMAELVGTAGIPGEPAATCNDCAMWPPAAGASAEPPGERAPREIFFSPATKCCTFLPELPNFLVGAILEDESSDPAAFHGRRTVEARIAAKEAVSPLGLGRTVSFAVRYRHQPDQFGQKQSLRCPHYVEQGGLCGVWRHRESTCATWFCKHTRGLLGVRFWAALQALLGRIERHLSRWCARELGADGPALAALFDAGTAPLWNTRASFATHLMGSQLDTRPSPGLRRLGAMNTEAYAALWGDWAGREAELYRRAAGLVAPLSYADLLERIGAPLEGLAERVLAAHRALGSSEVPERLRRRPVDLVRIGETHARLHAYRAYDPCDVPLRLYDELDRFDGRPAAEVLAELAEQRGLALSPALLSKLVEFGILEPAEE